MLHRTFLILLASLVAIAPTDLAGQSPSNAAIEAETLQHFQALLRLDTSNPPGNEVLAVDYLKAVLEKEGIPVQIFARAIRNDPIWSPASRGTARSGRCSSWATPTW
jgi:hypothetical protein